ncbi:MAG: hypothetical protein MZV49_00315 [Rhodopseudomonas palustris]|nr:hypothetical protein [Rhodopseudomonas palustris]
MQATKKRPYAKPRIERIDLVGEMQATAACKSATFLDTKKIGRRCTRSNACKSVIGS